MAAWTMSSGTSPSKRRVGGPAEQAGGLVHQGQLARIGQIQGAQELAIGLVRHPTWCPAPGPGAGRSAMSFWAGAGMVRRSPTLRLEHDAGRFHPGHQRDLRVPVLHGQRGVGRRACRCRRRTRLPGRGSAGDAPPRARSSSMRLSPISRSSCSISRGGAGVKGFLDADVVELFPAADDGPFKGGVGDGPGGIEGEGPQVGAAVLLRQQRTRVLADGLGVQGDPAVRQVDGLAAQPGLGVEAAAQGDEAGHVGDRVVHQVALADPGPGAPPGPGRWRWPGRW